MIDLFSFPAEDSDRLNAARGVTMVLLERGHRLTQSRLVRCGSDRMASCSRSPTP
jgi:hypothetical protein